MKKAIKKLVVTLVTISMMGSLFACSNKETGDQEEKVKAVTKATNSPSPSIKVAEAAIPTEEPTEPALTEEEQIMQDMIDRSLLGTGNNYRMKKVMEKAKMGKEVTLAYIGGSITEGYNAGTENNYAKLSYEYFADTYGSRDTVHLVNAGLSGTPSTLGLIRSERDIFAYNPDIVFIEFAVNDAQSGIDSAAFESLIAKALKKENEPAVVLLFSVIKTGYTCQTQMQLTGFNYKLPMISVANVLQPEFDAGRMTWEDWSNDESHPNEYGHKLYSEFIINYFKTVNALEIEEPAEMPKRFVTGADYTEMEMYDKTNSELTQLGSFREETGHPAFPNGWVKAQGSSENEGVQFIINAKSFFVVYKEVNSDSFGRAEVFVDGVLATNLAGNTTAGWNNPKASYVFRNKESAEHTIEIKMAAGDEDKAFAFLAYGICP
ncbi:MAG: SGNH/GDSL hydrolase family protein [Mobilitalea sp.]